MLNFYNISKKKKKTEVKIEYILRMITVYNHCDVCTHKKEPKVCTSCKLNANAL